MNVKFQEKNAVSAVHPNYIVDQQSNKTAVVLSLKEWTALLEDLEELEDIRAYDTAKKEPQDAVPFKQAIAKIRSKS